MSDIRDALLVARNSEGKLVQRPLSPHLQIYRPQITSFTSISHRVSGVALSAGTLLMTWWLVAAATSPAAFDRVQHFIGSFIGKLMLFGWTLALVWHFAMGLRHLFWDAGHGFELKQVHATGRAAIIAAPVLTILIWIVGLILWHGAR